nr:hypothetical protein [Candidatus Omnitrophota bacterium]
MTNHSSKRTLPWPSKIVIYFTLLTFFSSNLILPQTLQAQTLPTILNLPAPGVMVTPTASFIPAVIKGIKIFPDNPLRFDFIIDTGNTQLDDEAFKAESSKLIRYFMASLTVPENELWVNLSPYEKDRIIPKKFGETEMGRDLLAQDYVLKQLTASMIYPEKELGSEFWKRIYAKAHEQYGATEIPVNTFNKVWIIPEKAVVYESGDVAFVVESHLKVMLEGDYLALQKNMNNESIGTDQLADDQTQGLSDASSEIIRDIILPEIEREVNDGKNFALLRQVYNSLILATWFKRNLKESLLGKVYVEQNKVSGVDIDDKQTSQKIYEQYLEAFKVGVYNYVKEEYNPVSQEMIPRKYFSGGMGFDGKKIDKAMLVEKKNANEILMGIKKTGLQKTVSVGLKGINNGTAGRDIRLKSEGSEIDSAMLSEAESVDLAEYINYRNLFNAEQEPLKENDVKEFVTQLKKFKEVVQENSSGLAKTDDLITRQAPIEQSILELVSNASDAITGRSSPIGRFGVGAMQMLAFVLDENNPVLEQGAHIVVDTHTAEGTSRRVTFFKGTDGRIKFNIQNSDRKKTGTMVSIKFPQNIEPKMRGLLQQFLEGRLNLFTKMKINLNGKMINPLDDYIYLNGDKVQYDHPDKNINVTMTDDEIVVEDTGSGMSDDVILNKYLIPRLGENDARKVQTQEDIERDVHIFYKGPQQPDEKATTRIVFQVAGINIQSSEIEGYGLPKEMIIQLPSSTQLTVSRDKIEINKSTHTAIRVMAKKIVERNPIHQIELMNGFMSAVKLLDELNTRVDASPPLLDSAKEIFIPFVMEKQVKQSGLLILPNEPLYRELDVPQDTLFLDKDITYKISPDQILGSENVTHDFREGRLKKVFIVPFKEGSKDAYIESGPYLLLDKKLYEKLKDYPMLPNLLLNFYPGYGRRAPPKGWFLSAGEIEEKRQKELPILPILEEFTTLKNVLSEPQTEWLQDYMRAKSPKKILSESQLEQMMKIIAEIDTNDLRKVGERFRKLNKDDKDWAILADSHGGSSFASRSIQTNSSIEASEENLKMLFQKMNQFIESVPEYIRDQIEWKDILPMKGNDAKDFEQLLGNPSQILMADEGFMNLHEDFFLNQDHPQRMKRYLKNLLISGYLMNGKDQTTVHKIISQLDAKGLEKVDAEVITYVTEVFKDRNMEDFEKAFQGINEALPFIFGDVIKMVIMKWLRIYKSDPKATTETFFELMSQSYTREETENLQDLGVNLDRDIEGYATAITPDGKYIMTKTDDNDKEVKVWDMKTGELKHTWKDFEHQITSIVSSSNSKYVVVAGYGNIPQIFDVESGLPGWSLGPAHTDDVNHVAISPDSRYVITVSDDQTAIIWDVEKREKKLLSGPSGHTNWVTMSVVSPDSKYVITGSQDKTAKIWDIEKGIFRGTLNHGEKVSDVFLSPDSKYVVTVSADHMTKVWDIVSRELKLTFDSYEGFTESEVFTPDGKHMITYDVDKNRVEVWNIEKGAVTGNQIGSEGEVGLNVRSGILIDNTHIILTEGNNTPEIVDFETGVTIEMKGHTAAVNEIAVTLDKKYIITASLDNTVKMWDSRTGELKWTNNVDKVTEFVLSPKGTYVATISKDKTVNIWDIQSGTLKRTINITEDERNVFFSVDEKQIITSDGQSRKTRIWDLDAEAREEMKNFNVNFRYDIKGSFAKPTPDGKYLAVFNRDEINFWNIKTGTIEKTLPYAGDGDSSINIVFSDDGKYVDITHGAGRGQDMRSTYNVDTGEFKSAEFGLFSKLALGVKSYIPMPYGTRLSQDGRYVFSSDVKDNVLNLYMVRNATERNWVGFQNYNNKIHSLVVTADGQEAIIHSENSKGDHIIEVWDARTGMPKRDNHVVGKINNMVMSPDEKTLMISVGNELRILDIYTFEVIRTLKDDDNKGSLLEFNEAVFTPDGKKVIAGSDDDTVKIWDFKSGKLLETLKGHKGQVKRVSVSADGKHIFSTSNEDTKIWNIETGTKEQPKDFNVKFAREIKSAFEAISPDGKHLIGINKIDGQYGLEMHDMNTGDLKFRVTDGYEDYDGDIIDFGFAPDGKYFFTLRQVDDSKDSFTKIARRSLETGKRDSGTDIRGKKALMSSDGRYLIYVLIDNKLTIDDRESGELKEIEFPGISMNDVEISLDGKHVLVKDDKNKIHILRMLDGASIKTMEWYEGNNFKNRVDWVSIVPNGVDVLTIDANHKIEVRNIKTDELKLSEVQHGPTVTDSYVRNNGQYLIVHGDDGTIKIRDMRTKELNSAVLKKEKEDSYHDFVISANGQYIAAKDLFFGGKKAERIKIWDAITGQLLQTVDTDQIPMAFSPDGKKLITYNNTIGEKASTKVWDIEGKPKDKPKDSNVSFGHEVTGEYSKITPDGKSVITAEKFFEGGEGYTVHIWDAKTGQLKKTLEQNFGSKKIEDVSQLVVTPDGKYVRILDQGSRVWSWDLNTSEFKSVYPPGVKKEISLDGRYVVEKGSGNTFIIYDYENGLAIHPLGGPENRQIEKWKISQDGKHVVTVNTDETMDVWDIETGLYERTLSQGHTEVDKIFFSPDGKNVILVFEDGGISFDEPLSGHSMHIRNDVNTLTSVEVSTDWKYMLVSHLDGKVNKWDIETKTVIKTFEQDARANAILDAKFSPDGKYVISGSINGFILVWDAESGDLLEVLPGHTSKVLQVSISADQKHIVSNSANETIIWDFTPKQEGSKGKTGIKIPDGPTGSYYDSENVVNSFKLTGIEYDGKPVFATSANGKVAFLTMNRFTGENEVLAFKNNTGNIKSIEYVGLSEEGDSHLFIGADTDGTILQLKLNLQDKQIDQRLVARDKELLEDLRNALGEYRRGTASLPLKDVSIKSTGLIKNGKKIFLLTAKNSAVEGTKSFVDLVTFDEKNGLEKFMDLSGFAKPISIVSDLEKPLVIAGGYAFYTIDLDNKELKPINSLKFKDSREIRIDNNVQYHFTKVVHSDEQGNIIIAAVETSYELARGVGNLALFSLNIYTKELNQLMEHILYGPIEDMQVLEKGEEPIIALTNSSTISAKPLSIEKIDLKNESVTLIKNYGEEVFGKDHAPSAIHYDPKSQILAVSTQKSIESLRDLKSIKIKNEIEEIEVDEESGIVVDEPMMSAEGSPRSIFFFDFKGEEEVSDDQDETSLARIRTGWEALQAKDDLDGLSSLARTIARFLKEKEVALIQEEKPDGRNAEWQTTDELKEPVSLALLNYLYERLSSQIKANPDITFQELLPMIDQFRGKNLTNYTKIIRSAIEGQDKTQRAWVREIGIQNPRDATRRAREEGSLPLEDGEIQLRNFTDGENWVFSVRDNGTGMNLSDLIRFLFPLDQSSKDSKLDTGNLGQGFYTLFADFDGAFIRTSTGDGIIHELEIVRDDAQGPVIEKWNILKGDFNGTEMRREKKIENSDPQLESLFIQEALTRFAGAIQSPESKKEKGLESDIRDVKILYNGETFREDIDTVEHSSLGDNGGDISVGRADKKYKKRVIQDGIFIKDPDAKELKFIPKWLQAAYERFGGLHINLPRDILLNIPRTGYSQEHKFLHRLQVAVLHNVMKSLLKDYTDRGAKIPGMPQGYIYDENADDKKEAQEIARLMQDGKYDEISAEMLNPYLKNPKDFFELLTHLVFTSKAYNGPMTLNEIRERFMKQSGMRERRTGFLNDAIKNTKFNNDFTPKGEFAEDLRDAVGLDIMTALSGGEIGGIMDILVKGQMAPETPPEEIWKRLPPEAKTLFDYLSIRLIRPIVGDAVPSFGYYHKHDGISAFARGESIMWNLAYNEKTAKMLVELSQDKERLKEELQKGEEGALWKLIETLVHESQHLPMFEQPGDHTHHGNEAIEGLDKKENNMFGARMEEAIKKILNDLDNDVISEFSRSSEYMKDYIEKNKRGSTHLDSAMLSSENKSDKAMLVDSPEIKKVKQFFETLISRREAVRDAILVAGKDSKKSLQDNLTKIFTSHKFKNHQEFSKVLGDDGDSTEDAVEFLIQMGSDIDMNYDGVTRYMNILIKEIGGKEVDKKRLVESVLDAYIFYQLFRLELYFNRADENKIFTEQTRLALKNLNKDFSQRPKGWFFTNIPPLALYESRVVKDEKALVERQLTAVSIEGVTVPKEFQKRIKLILKRAPRLGGHVKARRYSQNNQIISYGRDSEIFMNDTVDYTLLMIYLVQLLKAYMAPAELLGNEIKRDDLVYAIYSALSSDPKVLLDFKKMGYRDDYDYGEGPAFPSLMGEVFKKYEDLLKTLAQSLWPDFEESLVIKEKVKKGGSLGSPAVFGSDLVAAAILYNLRNPDDPLSEEWFTDFYSPSGMGEKKEKFAKAVATIMGEPVEAQLNRAKLAHQDLREALNKLDEKSEGQPADLAMLSNSDENYGITAEEFTMHLQHIILNSWDYLPKETQEIMSNFGTVEYWKNFAERGGENNSGLFMYALPAVKELIVDQVSLETVGNQLVELAKAAPGGEAFYIFKDGLLPMKKSFGEEFNDYWPELAELGAAAGGHYAEELFSIGFPHMKQLYGEKFNDYWPELVKLGRATGKNAYTLFMYSLPEVEELITDKESLIRVGNQLVELINAAGENAYTLFIDGFPSLKQLFAEKFYDYWPELAELGKASGKNANTLFKDGFPQVKEWITDKESLKSTGSQLAELANTAGENAKDLFSQDFRNMKELITDQESLQTVGNQLIELRKATGKNAQSFFSLLENLKRSAEENFTKDFKYVWHPVLLRLARSVNEYNGERVFELIFSKFHLQSIPHGNHAKHLNFYAELLEENRRLGYQIIEGLKESLKAGKVSVELTDEEQETIKTFVQKTNGMNPAFYSVYLEKGDEGLEEVRIIAEKALRDELSPEDIRAYQAEMISQGLEGKEIALAAVAMVIPMSGASFVKRGEIMGLFDKYLEVGDRRSDIPETLQNFIHVGKEYQQVNYEIKPGEVLDQEGRVGELLNKLRYPNSGKSAQEIQTIKEVSKKDFVKTLKVYLADRKNLGKKEKAIDRFYGYVRHNDLLKEKVDAIQGLDYVNLENLGALFSDKDQLRVLLTEVLDKDIEEILLSQHGDREIPIDQVAGLIKQLDRIWKNTETSEANKVLALGSILKVYKKSDLESKLIVQLNSELKEVVQGLVAGELTAQVSKKQIGDELFNPIVNLIETEKGKYDSRESGEAIELEYRVVKGAAHGLWGLCAGVCIATDVELWKKKSFSLLSMVDKTRGQVVGYIHLYEAEENGEKVLTIPGIEPSAELLGEVKARDLYPDMIEAIQAVAIQGGYENIYLPVSEYILSNRSDIQKLAKKAGYEKKILDEEIEWNTKPSAYPFKEVYVIPMETATDSAILSSAKAKGGITPEEYAASIQQNVGRITPLWEDLPEESRKILLTTGTLKEWKDLVETSEEYGDELLIYALPLVKEALGEKFEEYWPELVELGKTSGSSAFVLIGYGIPLTKKAFGEKFDDYWPELVELGKVSGEDGRLLFQFVFPRAKEALGERFDDYWPEFIRIVKASGENAGPLLYHSLPVLDDWMTDPEKLKIIGNQLVELNETAGYKAEDLFRDGLPGAKETLGEKFNEYWPDLVELGKAVGINAPHLFKNGLRVTKKELGEKFDEYWPDLVKLGKAAGAAGENSDNLFYGGLGFAKESLGEKFNDYWPKLVEIGKAVRLNTGFLFRVFPTVKRMVGEDFIKNFESVWSPLFLRLGRAVNDYNGERVIKLIFDESKIFDWIVNNKGSYVKHLNFYAELLEENPRLGYQILEGLFEILKSGKVSVEITDEEQKTIRTFIQKTNGMNPSLYDLYLEKGDEGLKEVRIIAEKALKDELSPEDIRAYQTEMNNQGYEGKELALAAVGMVIPTSGASFVKREEIMGLFDRYLEAGDRRSDIPESLKNFVHSGNKYQKVIYHLKLGEVLDQEGRVKEILSKLRYPDSGKSEVEIQKLRDAAKRDFVKTLKIYLTDRKNQGKKEKAVDRFYGYVRHNDLLKEKVDAIQGLDYVNLENLGALFSDKDQLRVLLTEVLDKDIEQTFLIQEGQREITMDQVLGLTKQLNGIWNNPKANEENKTLALNNILKVYKKDDLQNKLIVQLDSELKEAVQGIVDGEMTAQVSKKQIGDELLNPVFDLIEAEKNKYESKESNKVIELEYRVVKGAAHGLWGLCAGVCIATDVNLWNKKTFSLLT